MSTETKNKLVPRLRFPEFQNEGEWEVKKLGEVFKSFSGGTPDTAKKEYYHGKIPFIRSAEIGKTSTELFLTELGLKNSSAKMVSKGDLLVALYGANSGDVAISKIDGAINQAILCLKSDFSNEFTYHFLSSKKDCIVSKYVQGGQGNLSGEIIKSILLPLPSLPEQQKIASCLSSIDEVITGEQQKLELLKQHKKGLLQNLFPQEGETVPKLRFKEFENSGEWEVKKLGEVAEIITGNTPSTSVKDYYGGEFMFVSPADINNNRYVTNTQTSLTELGFSQTRKIKENSILFVCIGSTIGKVAQNKYECATNQQINSLIPLQNISNNFLYSLLETNSKNIALLAGNQAVPIINKTLFSSVSLPFPSLPEQQKIASCLSSLDDLITAQTQKIEQLQRHKKGLLQGLFPNMNEQHG